MTTKTSKPRKTRKQIAGKPADQYNIRLVGQYLVEPEDNFDAKDGFKYMSKNNSLVSAKFKRAARARLELAPDRFSVKPLEVFTESKGFDPNCNYRNIQRILVMDSHPQCLLIGCQADSGQKVWLLCEAASPAEHHEILEGLRHRSQHLYPDLVFHSEENSHSTVNLANNNHLTDPDYSIEPTRNHLYQIETVPEQVNPTRSAVPQKQLMQSYPMREMEPRPVALDTVASVAQPKLYSPPQVYVNPGFEEKDVTVASRQAPVAKPPQRDLHVYQSHDDYKDKSAVVMPDYPVTRKPVDRLSVSDSFANNIRLSRYANNASHEENVPPPKLVTRSENYNPRFAADQSEPIYSVSSRSIYKDRSPERESSSFLLQTDPMDVVEQHKLSVKSSSQNQARNHSNLGSRDEPLMKTLDDSKLLASPRLSQDFSLRLETISRHSAKIYETENRFSYDPRRDKLEVDNEGEIYVYCAQYDKNATEEYILHLEQKNMSVSSKSPLIGGQHVNEIDSQF